jgi:hypothetical protein
LTAEMDTPIAGPMWRECARNNRAVRKVADVFGHGDSLDIVTGLDFGGNRFRNVVRPMLKCAECDNADWIIELASQEIGDDGFEVRPLDLGFAVDGATCAKAVHNEVNSLIGPIGHELRGPARSWHKHLQRTGPGAYTIIGGGRWQLPKGTRPTANQEALRARCYSRCSTASPAFDLPLSRRQLDGLSLSQLRRLPRWPISVLERGQSLRGRKGPAGCHRSRFILQANKQPIDSKRELFRYSHFSRNIANVAAGAPSIAPTQSRSRPRSTSNRADSSALSSQSLASRHGKYRRCSHKRLWRS